MEGDSDDDFERVSDFNMSESEDEQDIPADDTPGSTPPTRNLRPSEQKTHQCPVENCIKTFNRQARLKEHLRSHTNSRLLKCPHTPCTKDYLRESHLSHHIKSAHSDVRDYKCTWAGCDKKFLTGTRLRRHLEVHEGRERFRCRGYPGCNETFRKHDTLQRHVISVHKKMKPFPCPDEDSRSGQKCTKAFDTAEKLRQHQRVNHDTTRFSCSDCLAQNAITLANGDAHLVPHLTKAFFATYGELQEHLALVHPPTCSHCQTAFSTAKELTRHLELQHDIKQPNSNSAVTEFKCDYPNCEKSYSKRGNLNVHIKTTHQSRRDFICGKTELPLPEEMPLGTVVYGCGRDFTSKASLEDHVRTAHLSLESKRMKREKKRKAEDVEDGAIESKKVQSRKPRKDKGIKKKSAIDALSGGPVLEFSTPIQMRNPAVEEEIDVPDCEEDDYEALSGSMTILGSHLYHRTGEYCYTMGQYPEGHRAPEAHYLQAEQRDLSDRPMNGDDEQDDGFFGDFERDASSGLDPRLLYRDLSLRL